MRLTLIVILCGLVAGPAFAEMPDARPDLTVRAVLPGCRSLLASQGMPASAEAGFCSGMIDSLLYLGPALPGDLCFSVPMDVPRLRVVEAIVEEVAAVYPSAKENHFRALAIEVLEYRWPCRPA